MLVTAVVAVLLGLRVPKETRVLQSIRRLASRQHLVRAFVAGAAIVGCWAVARGSAEHAPLVHDEFSFLLMGKTFASGRLAAPAPPLPEFFDSPHVLLTPTHASKYPPAQGVVLAAGQLLAEKPLIGVWLSSALAAVAICRMLQVWLGPIAGLVGGIIATLQFCVFGYWSQSYWGGMPAALGGALWFTSLRVLRERPTVWIGAEMGVAVAILLASRPLEGAVTIVISLTALAVGGCSTRPDRAAPAVTAALVVTLVAMTGLGLYHRRVTGSAILPPYLLHERQYQAYPVSPLVSSPPVRISYRHARIASYYLEYERALYESVASFRASIIGSVGKLRDWWRFSVGPLLSIPVLVAIWSRKSGWLRHVQLAVLIAWIALWSMLVPAGLPATLVMWICIFVQAGICIGRASDGWEKMAVVACVLLAMQVLVVKSFQPHYQAPIACLLVYLVVAALRAVWTTDAIRSLGVLVFGGWLICSTADVLGAATGLWSPNRTRGAASALLLNEDTPGHHRQRVVHALERATDRQLVFVRYPALDAPLFEWVYNDPDIIGSRIVWAHDLGPAANCLLIKRVQPHEVWLLNAGAPAPTLLPYRSNVAR